MLRQAPPDPDAEFVPLSQQCACGALTAVLHRPSRARVGQHINPCQVLFSHDLPASRGAVAPQGTGGGAAAAARQAAAPLQPG